MPAARLRLCRYHGLCKGEYGLDFHGLAAVHVNVRAGAICVAAGPGCIRMEQDTLTEILGIEKVIRDKLDAEREQATAWREQARSTIEQAHQAELERLREAALQHEAAAKQAAGARAAAIVLEATTAAAAIERFQDDDLRPYVRQHIACIAPGMSRDH